MADSKTELNLPTNYEIKSSLKEGERVIDDFKETPKGQEIGVAGQILLKDTKKLLQDGREAIGTINQGDKAQHIANNGWGIVKDIAFDPNLQEMFFNWNSIASHLTAGADLTDLMKSCGQLLLSIRDSQKFIELLADLVKMLRLLVSERTEQVATFGTDDFKNAGKAEAKQIEQTKEQAIKDLRGMIKQLSENETWNRIVRNSQKIVDKVTDAAHQVAAVSKELGEDVAKTELDRFDSIIEDLSTLLQRAVGDKADINKLFDYTKRAIKDIAEDERFPTLLREIQDVLTKCAENPSEVDTEATSKQLKESYSQLQVITSDLKENFNVRHAQRESQKLLNALKANSQNSQLVADVQKLMFDVRSNRPGEVFDPNVLSSLRQMLVPMLLDLMHNVPLPPIHDTFEFLGTYNVTLEDITVSLPDLIPENIHVNIDYDMDANVRALEATNQHVYVNIVAKNIQVHMHDVSWAYERQSTPKLQDSGKVSIDTGKNGITLKLRMEAKSDPQRTLVEMLNVQAYTLDDWHITFKDSKHNTLYRVLSGVFSDTIKQEIRKAIEKNLMGLGKTVNDKLVETLYVAQKQGWQAAHNAQTSTSSIAGSVKDAASSVAHAVGSIPAHAASAQIDLEHKALELAKELILAGKIDAQTLSDIAQKGGEVASTVVDAVQNNAQAAGQKVAEVAKDGSAKAADVVQAAGEKGGELAAKAGDKVEAGAKQAGDAAASGARAAGDAVGKNAQPVANKVADAAEKTGDKVAEGAKKAGDKVGEAGKQAGEKVAEGAEKAGSKAAEGARKAGDKAEEAGDKVAEKAPKAADKVAEKAEQAGDKTKEAAHKAGDKAQEAGLKAGDKAEQAGDKAKEVAHKAGDKAQEAGHKAGEKAEQAGDKTKEAAHKAGDKAQEAGEEAHEETHGNKRHSRGNKRHSQEHKTQDTAHKAGDKAEQAADKTKEVAHKAGDKAQEAGHKVGEKAEQAADKTKEVAHKAGDKAQEAGHKAKEAGHKAGDKAQEAGHKAGEKAQELGDKAKDAGHQAGDKAKETAHKAGDKAQEAGHKAGEKAKEAGDKVAEKSQEAGRQAHKAADKTADKAEEAGHAVASKAKEAGDKVAEKAPAAGEKVADKAQQAGQKTAEAARSAGDKVAEKAPQAGEKVAQKAEAAGQAIGDKAKEVGDKAAENLPKAGEKGAELVRTAGEKVAAGAEKVGDAVANADVYGAVDTARDKVQGAGDSVASGLGSLEDKLREKAAEKGAQQTSTTTTAKASQGK